MEIRDNTIEFQDLDGRDMFAAVVSDGESGYFTIAISYNQKHQIKLDAILPDDKKITNTNLMEEAQKVIAHWILEKEGVLSNFNISQRKFMDLIFCDINTMFVNGEDYVIQSKNKGDVYNLIINEETIREENYLADGSSMSSILYGQGNPLEEETDGEYLDEETRKEYERLNQSINGINDIFEIIAEKCTDNRVNKKRLWFDVKRKYNLKSDGELCYSYSDKVIINQKIGEETKVDEEIKNRFFDNLVEQSANEKMIKMFHQLLTKKERKILKLIREIESRYDKIVDGIDTDTGKIIFKG